MKLRMPGQSHTGPLPPLTDGLAGLAADLERDVRRLAVDIGERHVGRPTALERATGAIEEWFGAAGLVPERQRFVAHGHEVANVEAELPGDDRVLVVGAHYDTVPGTPGANDNGSGVAALVALARLLRGRALRRTVRLVGFVNEEPPYFQSPAMGSYQYARRCRQRRDRIDGMLSLETIGCFSDEPGSQQYPFPFRAFYPTTGNFIAFVGNSRSTRFVARCTRLFREQVAFPCEGAALPGWITGVGWSDQWSFWQHGFAALMVTDTAPFRYVHYHAPTDTPEQIDFERMARVVDGLARVIATLAS